MSLSRSELQLSRGRIGPLFLRYTMPGIFAMVFLALQTIADGFIVGRLIGADALASVNIAAPVYTMVTAIAMIIGVGTQAQVGIKMGAGDYSAAKTAFASGGVGLALFAFIGTLFVNFFAEDLATALGANEELLDGTVGYIHGVMPWLFGLAAHVFFDNMLKATGHPRFAMAITVSTIVTNVVLSVIFVGACGMGTFGAGLGTGISFTVGAIASALIFFREYGRNSALKAAKARFSSGTLGHIIYNGSSEGMSEIAYGITTFLFNITLMKYVGKEGVSAFTLINYISYLGMSISLGVSTGLIPVISYNSGAGNVKRVRRVVNLGVKVNTSCGLFFMLMMFLFGRQICGAFLDAGETQVLDFAVLGAKLTALAFFFNGFNILSSSYFTAIDKAGHSLLVSSLRGLILLSVGIVALPIFFDYVGIMLAMPIAELLTFVVALLLMRKYVYKS